MKKLFALSLMFSLVISTAFTQSKVKMKRNDDKQKIDVIIDGKPFTSYQYPKDLEKPFLSPVYAPNGSVITRGFPLEPRKGERIDHPHHIGIWFNHGNVNGLDFWNNSSAIPEDKKADYGRIVVRSVDKVKGGKSGIIEVTSDWKDVKGNTILTERTSWIISGTPDTRTIDRISTLTANGKVTITDNKEGLFAIRVDRAFEMPTNEALIFTDEKGNPTTVKATDNKGVTGMYISSSGLKGDRVWGTRNNWVLLSGTKDGALTTFGIFDHPDNPGFPAYAHARGYGLFSVNNLGQNAYDQKKEKVVYNLAPGESMTLRHRFYIRSGEVTKDQAEMVFRDFAGKY